MYLEEIVEGIHIESSNCEMKSRLNRENIEGWLKTIAGFANAEGGEFFIGVEDKTNKLIGFDRVGADNERNFFNNTVNEHLIPRPNMDIIFVRYIIKDSERFIIRVKVPKSDIRPVVLKMNGVPSIYMRREGFTNGATYEEIIEMSIRSKNTQYDTLPSNRKYKAEDFSELRTFYSEHNNGKQLSEKALRSMGFFDENGFLSNGAVLFADDYDEGKTDVMCSLFSGFDKGSKRIISINRYHGNIIRIIKATMEFVLLRMNYLMEKTDTSRNNVEAYPQRALFEAVINAIAHRDYYLDGTQIQVDMFRDRLEIISPGGFYRGEQFEKTYNLSGIISKRRNELITSILVSCNVMEAAGTGFDKIMEEYSGVDDGHRPYISSASDHFTLVLPDLTYEEGLHDPSLPELSYASIPNGTAHDNKILRFCYPKARKISEIADYLGIKDSNYFRKKILENLISNKYLDKSDNGRVTYLKTNPDAVTLL